VGWWIDSAQTSTLVTNALGMAISNRVPRHVRATTKRDHARSRLRAMLVTMA
jgi:hypothetical protein